MSNEVDVSLYVERGFENRKDYLDNLAEEYGERAVKALSDMLGPSEDFDALVTMLEDFAEAMV